MAVAVSASGLQAIVPVATANAAASGSQADVSEAPNTASAMKAARAAGHRVLDLSQSTETSKAWINPDGSTSLSSYSAPVQARTAGGSWAPIDTTLVTDAAGVHPKAVTDPVTLGNGSSTSLLSVPGVKGFGLDWLAKLPAPTMSGDTATYANVLPGADLTVTAQPSGFEFSLVLGALPAKPLPATVSLPVKGDLTATVTAGGGLQLTDRSGTVLASGPAPVVHDAADPATGEPYHTQPLPMSVTGSPGAQKLVLTMPTAFLADPTTVYPVVVDPTVSFSEYDSTYVYTLNGVSQPNPGNTAHLHMGYKASNLEKSRTLLQYTLSSLSGKHILSASLSAYNELSLNCTATTTQLFPITSAYTMNTVTWATMPTLGTQAGSATFAYGASGCAHNWVTFSGSGMTTMVQNWADGTVGMNGVLLKATTETDGNSYRQWASRYGGGGEPTRIDVTYNSYPGTTAGRYMAPYNKDASGAWWTRSTTPALKGTGPDADGGTSRLHGEIWNATRTTRYFVGDGNSTPVLTTSTLNDTYPLTDGVKYSWRAQMFDGIDYSQAWSSWIDFTVDTTAPSAPTVSSTSYPANTWSPAGGAGTFTLSSSDGTGSGVSYYLYGLDSGGVVNQQLGVGVTSLPISTMPDGWHTLTVQAVDVAGNISSPTSYQFGSTPGITSLSEGRKTQGSIALSAMAAGSASTAITFNYRKADTDSWAPIPPGDVTLNGVALNTSPNTNWPVTGTLGTVPGTLPADAVSAVLTPANLVWNVAQTLGDLDGQVQLQVCYGSACTTQTRHVELNENAFGDSYATSSFGPGSVSLLTGNYSISQSDVTVPAYGSSLTVGRTFNSRTPTLAGPLGPGWQLSLPSDGAGSDWVGLDDTNSSLITLTGADGSTVSYAKTGTSGTNTTYTATGDATGDGTVLTTPTGTPGSSYTLTDLDSNLVTFTGSGIAHKFLVSSTVTDSAASDGGQKMSYGIGGGLTRVILAPAPAGVTCSYTLGAAPSYTPTWTSFGTGCRALELSYSSGLLNAVTLDVNTSGSTTQVDVACYGYDSNGRLAQTWDPREGTAGSGSHPVTCGGPVLATSYDYYVPDPLHPDPARDGKVKTVTPAGLAGYTIGYDDSGRASTVARTHSGRYGIGSETDTVAYGISLAADGSHPEYRPSMQTADLAGWAQTDLPTTVTVVYGPGDKVSSSDLRDGTVHYLDVNGREVNTASYSGTDAAGWHLATTEYDSTGNPIRTLSPANREEALNPTGAAGSALGLPVDTAQAALALSTVSQYSTGSDLVQDLTDSYGPYHLVALGSAGSDGMTEVGARLHTHTSYDNGGELGHPTGPTLHLVTATSTAASRSMAAAPVSESDTRTTSTDYALSATESGTGSTDSNGWALRQPMKTVEDSSGLARITRYDASTGDVIESRMPSNTSGGAAGTTLSTYYTAGLNSADSACGNHPEWANLICKTRPAAQPGTSGMPDLKTTWVSSYDYLDRPLVTQEIVGTTTRTSTVSHLNDGWGDRTATTSLTGGAGTAVPDTTVSYDPSSGLPVSTSAGPVASPVTTATTSYDDFGRTVGYTENDQATGAAANITTTSYDGSGRVASTQDAHTKLAYSYNGGTEHRGLATGLTVIVSGSTTYTGSYAASYDVNGAVVTQTDPNGVTTSLTRDENDQLTGLTGKSANPWLSDTVTPNIYGSWLVEINDAGSHHYTYDTLGRLSQGDNTPTGGVCASRQYTFDTDSNRLTSTSFPAGASDGRCQVSTGGVPTSHGYDSADRLTSANRDTGIAYDSFGRISTLPAADTSNNTTLASSYYANDLIRSQTQASTTICWTLDASQRLREAATYTASSCTGTVTADRTNHYDDPSSDSPSWIAENTAQTSWTANIRDLLGGLGLTVVQTGTASYQYANLHGDTLATAPAGATSPTISTDYDEYGQPTDGQSRRYGWLGSKQRSGDSLGGTLLMGVRTYSPQVGRFLSVDPVVGGSANSYDYTRQDPINKLDLAGTFSVDWHRGHIDLYIRHKDILAAGTVAAVVASGACGFLTVTGVYGAICWANVAILGIAVGAALGYKNGNVKVTIQWWGQVKIRMRKQ